MTPTQLAGLEDRRRRNGQFGSRVAGEAPEASIPGTSETVRVADVRVSDADSGPSNCAISQVASRTLSTTHAGYDVEVTDYAWVEATTAGFRFTAEEHSTAQFEQQGCPDDVDVTASVTGIDYQVATARVWRISRDGNVVAEQTKWSSSVSGVDSITDGDTEAADLVATFDLDPDDVEYEVGFVLDDDAVTSP